MGCIWSSSETDQCRHCTRRAVNNLIIINHECEVCIRRATRPRATTSSDQPRFGEYKCCCGRQWNSRLSWANSYQNCKRCQKVVFPCNQRELRPSDMCKDKENLQEHPKDLCQKCQQLGHYCGDTKKNNNRKGKRI